MTTPLLDARNLRFAYARRPVLHDISLSLALGQVMTLLGPNGSGKSTLIRVLLGQLHAAGELRWEGKPLRQWARRSLARTVAYLPQSPGWEPEQTVSDVLRLGRAPYLHMFGIESRRDLQVVHEVAEMLELSDLLGRRMDELSGGQRQRVFVGRCLVQEPRALLLDEPNTFLDLRHQVELSRLLKKLAAERGIGILMASHDLNLAGAFADRLLLLNEGAIAAAGTPDEVLRPAVLSQVYGLPIERVDLPQGSRPVVFPSVAVRSMI